MASIRDVARKAGVAISTVSKVLNHYPNVSEETRIKVNEAIRELKFTPNTIASALSSNCLLYTSPWYFSSFTISIPTALMMR